MPKTAKTSSNIANRRSAPYPVTTTQAIAPALSMATHAPSSPQPSGADRHTYQSWPPENDEMLMRARHQGLNWQPIASKYFPDKTANACRKRHERLMEKRTSAESWDGVKIEELAKAYNDVREQMWKILADRVGGEKWQIIEAKCMEKGLKTLQTAGRTASRRERAQIGGSDAEYDEITDSRYPAQRRARSKSHHDEIDEFNDSALGPDGEHSLYGTGNQTDQHTSYASSLHEQQAPYSAGGVTPPPYNQSGRSYSTSSSTGFTPTITAATQFPSAQQSGPYQQQQTLPSFSSAFGMPSISSVIHHQSPHHHTAVTTH